MTKIQGALRSGEYTVESLKEQLGINCKTHKLYPNLCMFKYNQISSPMENPIVQECRGIILDSEDYWNIVAYPFDKFFNEGDPLAAQVDWSTAKVQEKLDGSLMLLYCYKDGWLVASSGTPDASGRVNELPKMFCELFWDTFDFRKYKLPSGYEDHTFMFELTSPHNRVVIRHAEPGITLIGARNNKTLYEVPAKSLAGLDFPTVKEFDLDSTDAIADHFETVKGIDQEGFVVVDHKFNRIKIKHPDYVRLHHMKGNDGPSYKRMLEIVVKGESDEVLSYFPEWRPIHDKVKLRFIRLLLAVGGDFEEAKVRSRDRKEFANCAKTMRCPDALFRMYDGKFPTFHDYFNALPIEKVMKLLGYK